GLETYSKISDPQIASSQVGYVRTQRTLIA
ncbi:MAG: hypothetical protein ACI96M_004317, partial [Candidatus Azotimanducaceae bacterium]